MFCNCKNFFYVQQWNWRAYTTLTSCSNAFSPSFTSSHIYKRPLSWSVLKINFWWDVWQDVEFSYIVIYRSAFKRRNYSLNSTLHQLTVDHASLCSGAQFCVIRSLVILLNFIASQVATVQLIINTTFWSGKTMVSDLYVNLIVAGLALCSVASKGATLVLWWEWYSRSVRSCQTRHWPCRLLGIPHHRLEISIFFQRVHTKFPHTLSKIWTISG